MDAIDLAAQCAPFVEPRLVAAVIHTESAGNPFAINVNNSHLKPKPKTYAQAVREAAELIAQGKSVDLGLMQINSKNLQSLGVPLEKIFDPCANVYVGATVLWRFHYRSVKKDGMQSGDSLIKAISAYNTGSFNRGLRNGYVDKIVENYNKILNGQLRVIVNIKRNK